jgi:hypothetical protein
MGMSIEPSRHLSQLGRRGMKFGRIGSCEIVLWSAVVWVNPFFAWRETFSPSVAVSAHTLLRVDVSQKKVIRDPSFSRP